VKGKYFQPITFIAPKKTTTKINLTQTWIQMFASLN
jgi:hypothetical protein